MGLKLQVVTPRQGWTWMRDGMRLYLRRPIGFSAMLLFFLLVSTLITLLPYVGVIGLASLPLLSLGFMIGARAALRGGAVHPGQFIEPLRGDAARRRTLLLLCGLYGVLALGVVGLTVWVQGDSVDALRKALVAKGAASVEAARAMADPRLTNGLLVFGIAATLLSIPFWHAPALVYWGRQSLWQALFSSTIAMWRSKAAFAVYGLVWLAASFVLSIALGLVVGVLGAGSLVTLLAPLVAVVLSTAFYVSLWFTFVDSFGGDDEDGSSLDMQPPPSPQD
jgi:hypothetical protein